MKSDQSPSELPACITNALADRRGEKVRQAAENLASLMEGMLGVPCHVRIGEDFAFAMVIREFGKEAEGRAV